VFEFQKCLGSSAVKAMDSWTVVLKVGGLIPSSGMLFFLACLFFLVYI